MTHALRRVLVVATVIGIGVAFALAYGEAFGAKNQQTYLVDALVRAYPELYRNDWFVTQTHHYHVAFAWLTAPLFSIDPDGAPAFGVAHVIAMVALFGAIYGVVAATFPRWRLLVFLGIVGLLALGGGRSLGGSYLFAGYLQPSTLATLGWLAALNAWMRNRMLLAGIALGVGAAFHINYAFLGIGVFALCELAASRRLDWRRLLVLLGPSLVVVAVFLPILIASSRGTHGTIALDVLVKIVFPSHFKPSRIRIELFSLVGWHLIALACRPADDEPGRVRLFWFTMTVLASCIVAAVLVQIPPLLPFTRLFVWRIAPFGLLGAQLLLFARVFDIASRTSPWPKGWQLFGLVAGACLVVYNAYTRPRVPYPHVITVVMIAAAAAMVVRRTWFVQAMCAALCVLALWHGRVKLRHPVVFTRFDTGLTLWARDESPRDALFLAPPYYGDLRLFSQRAVVVDDKSPPMYMAEVETWFARLSASVDADRLVTIEDGWRRWDALTPPRLVAIAQHFRADYIVIDKARSAARLDLQIAYEDGINIVYAVSR